MRSDPVELAISASGGGYGCALRTADTTIDSATLDSTEPTAGGRGRDLATVVAELFAHAGVAPSALDAIALDVGPGSYTGLRVAVTFARTLAEFDGVALRVATSLELLAAHAALDLGVQRELTARVILDARRGKLHHASLRLTPRIELLQPPRAEPIDDALAAIGDGELIIASDALNALLAPAVDQRGCRRAAPHASAARLATLLFDPLLAPRTAAPQQVTPLYLMGSYAE